jgi:glutathione S-transferase
MTDLKLYIGSKRFSSWSLRPWLALQHTGAAFEEILIPLRQSDTAARIAAVSPSGRVPVLKHGTITVWDSLAICEYLADNFRAAKLWPGENAARAHARAISAEMHSGFGKLREHLPMDLIGDLSAHSKAAAAQNDIDRVCAIWREARQRFGQAGPFLFGAFTAADAMYAPVVTRFRTYGVPVDAVCGAYMQAVEDLPGFKAWHADAQKEA